jgi:amino acid permease
LQRSSTLHGTFTAGPVSNNFILYRAYYSYQWLVKQRPKNLWSIYWYGFILGFSSFVHKFDPITFVVNYVGIVLYVFWFVSYKLIRRTKFVGFCEMDITTNIVTKQYVEELERGISWLKHPFLLVIYLNSCHVFKISIFKRFRVLAHITICLNPDTLYGC